MLYRYATMRCARLPRDDTETVIIHYRATPIARHRTSYVTNTASYCSSDACCYVITIAAFRPMRHTLEAAPRFKEQDALGADYCCSFRHAFAELRCHYYMLFQ